ncbi:MAG: hypothetical protein V1835_00700 [Candidatus Micrarchaeota archaeon]
MPKRNLGAREAAEWLGRGQFSEAQKYALTHIFMRRENTSLPDLDKIRPDSPLDYRFPLTLQILHQCLADGDSFFTGLPAVESYAKAAKIRAGELRPLAVPFNVRGIQPKIPTISYRNMLINAQAHELAANELIPSLLDAFITKGLVQPRHVYSGKPVRHLDQDQNTFYFLPKKFHVAVRKAIKKWDIKIV